MLTKAEIGQSGFSTRSDVITLNKGKHLFQKMQEDCQNMLQAPLVHSETHVFT